MDQTANYTPPSFGSRAFHCPSCGTYAHQSWFDLGAIPEGLSPINGKRIGSMVSLCQHCMKYAYWIEKKLVYPPQIIAPRAHSDMPAAMLEYYDEARAVSTISPRAAATLLRIAIKKLCEHLGEKEKNLYKAIGNLQQRGLPEAVVKSLDTVRITGNEGGAHEGQIDLTGKDNEKVVEKLFWLVNFIVEKAIAEPNEIDEMFQAMPEGPKAAAESRDSGRNAASTDR